MKKLFFTLALLETACFGMQQFNQNQYDNIDENQQNEANFVKGLVKDLITEPFKNLFKTSINNVKNKINKTSIYGSEGVKNSINDILTDISNYASTCDKKNTVQKEYSETLLNAYQLGRSNDFFSGIYISTIQYLLETSDISSMSEFEERLKQLQKLKKLFNNNVKFIVTNCENACSCIMNTLIKNIYVGSYRMDRFVHKLSVIALGVYIGNLTDENCDNFDSDVEVVTYIRSMNTFGFFKMLIEKSNGKDCKFNTILNEILALNGLLTNNDEIYTCIKSNNNLINNENIQGYLEKIGITEKQIKEKKINQILGYLNDFIIGSKWNYISKGKLLDLLKYYDANLAELINNEYTQQQQKAEEEKKIKELKEKKIKEQEENKKSNPKRAKKSKKVRNFNDRSNTNKSQNSINKGQNDQNLTNNESSLISAKDNISVTLTQEEAERLERETAERIAAHATTQAEYIVLPERQKQINQFIDCRNFFIRTIRNYFSKHMTQEDVTKFTNQCNKAMSKNKLGDIYFDIKKKKNELKLDTIKDKILDDIKDKIWLLPYNFVITDYENQQNS